jgi:hypothetical protein
MKKWSYCAWKFLIDFQHDKQLFFKKLEKIENLINYCLKVSSKDDIYEGIVNFSFS